MKPRSIPILITGAIAIAALGSGPMYAKHHMHFLPRLKTLAKSANITRNQRKTREARRQRRAAGDKKAFQ